MTTLAFAQSIQLLPDASIIVHMLLIFFMVWILNKTMYKPINKILEERDKKTVGRSGEAHDILARVEEELTRYERTLREARGEGYRLLEQHRAEAMKDRQQKLNAIREEVEQQIADEKQSIAAQSDAAQRALQADAYVLAGQISSQILRRPVSY
jgi:F-type H+-transporting ATPase subunit b